MTLQTKKKTYGRKNLKEDEITTEKINIESMNNEINRLLHQKRLTEKKTVAPE